MRPEHRSIGDPCQRCGMSAARHRKRVRIGRPQRPQHASCGDPCDSCGLAASLHRARSPHEGGEKGARLDHIFGLDGEGKGRGPHRYVYLAAVDEAGKGLDIRVKGERALSTKASLDLILAIPQPSLVVAYGFNYDFTKIIKDLPNSLIYDLIHEKRRQFWDPETNRVHYRPVKWQGYRLNFMNGRLTISRGRRSVTVWDVIRFFQSKFTESLLDWSIGDVAAIEAMAEMKDKRSQFDKLDDDAIQTYCRSECQHLAHLARALINAHIDAGLNLKTFFGAGSTASALLTNIGVKDKRGDIPEAMREAVACAFFGGRFENSCTGPIERVCYNHDIASAYPYQTTFLPCLEHGLWEHVTSRSKIERAIQSSELALVKWSLPEQAGFRNMAWGPLPVRTSIGTIIFPLAAAGGWTWKQEFNNARQLFPHLEATEVWVYQRDCGCIPFGDIPALYLERVRIGKEAKGKVLKLGLNSIYGKLAQSKGLNPPYQSWVWAGNITSGTRAQLLTSIQSASDPWNILMFATDGVVSTEPLHLPSPRDTGTGHCGKPLGGWEGPTGPDADKFIYPDGVFAVRPGIVFPLNPSESQLKKVRARGLGKKVVYEQWQTIVAAWKKGQGTLRIGKHCPRPRCKGEFKSGRCDVCGNEKGGMQRFIGAKSALTLSPKTGTVKRSPLYGDWVDHEIEVSFSPLPKRSRAEGSRLLCWQHHPHFSHPYSSALISPEAEILRLQQALLEEQPDLDFATR